MLTYTERSFGHVGRVDFHHTAAAALDNLRFASDICHQSWLSTMVCDLDSPCDATVVIISGADVDVRKSVD